MYLTRFPINMTRRETRVMLSSPYRMHAAVQGSFARSLDVSDGRVLWRVDENADGSSTLFIVSPTEPSLVGLDEQIGWPDIEPQWQTRNYDAILNRLAEGQVYRFRLVANPVISRKSVTNRQGRTKRLPHVTPIQKMAWLIGEGALDGVDAKASTHPERSSESRAERNGFSVLRDDRSGEPQLVVSHEKQWRFNKSEGGNRISLSTARFDGALVITDAERLRRALICGIGHGKGFGCGLLTLARLA